MFKHIKVNEHYNRKAVGINILVDLYIILVLISLVSETDRHKIGPVSYKVTKIVTGSVVSFGIHHSDLTHTSSVMLITLS